MVDLLERSSTSSERQPGQTHPAAAINVCNLFATLPVSFTHHGWKCSTHTSQTNQEAAPPLQQATHDTAVHLLSTVSSKASFGTSCTGSQTARALGQGILESTVFLGHNDVTL